MVIIGVVAAIAIPRMTRGLTNTGATALKADLAKINNAIELYRAEHQGRFPNGDGPELPEGAEELAPDRDIVEQLTLYTRIDGTDPGTEPDVAAGRVYGPYLRAIPSLPAREMGQWRLLVVDDQLYVVETGVGFDGGVGLFYVDSQLVLAQVEKVGPDGKADPGPVVHDE